MTAAAVTVRRARLGPQWASAPGREALQRWLGDIDLARHRLPPQAIVIVRRLQAPAAALQAGHAGRHRHPDPLAEALRGALRPATEGAVGAGVTAVWFADEVELLACLARDALGLALGMRWWWPLLFGRAPTPALALQRWAAAPQALPWALAALGHTGQGAPWLRQIGPEGCLALVRVLAGSYPVCDAAADAVCAAASRSCAPAAPGRVTAVGQAVVHDEPALRSELTVPGLAVPGTAQRADQDGVRALLRLAEVLRVAPHRAASPALVAELLAPGDTVPALAVLRGDGRAGGARAAAVHDGAPAARPVRPVRNAATGRPLTRQMPAAAASEPPSAGGEPLPRANARAPSEVPPAGPASPGPASGPAHLPQPGTGFHTQFGGIAFLLNVALHLGLYGDFTQPQHRGLPLSPWSLLHAALKVGMGRASRGDPLAAWLHERAGAAPEPRLQDAWQLPAAALQPFDADVRPWHALAGAGRLQLWHPAGFCIAHLHTAAGLPSVLAALQRPQQTVVVHAAAVALPAPRLSTLVWPLLRARLALALGLPTRAAVALALPLPARLQAHAARTDLHFSLASLPLAVRLAGLDRDPGWLPAAGSDIRFHFD